MISQFAEGHLETLFYLQILKFCISRLLGDQSEGISDEDLERSISKNPAQYKIFLCTKLYMAILFNNYDGMMLSEEEYTKISKRPLFLHSAYSKHPFYFALMCYRAYRETREPKWLERAKKHHNDIDSWCVQSSKWNFEHINILLQAEEMHSTGDIENAHGLYKNAIGLASRSKFIIDEALFSELAANFCLKTARKSNAFHYYSMAHSKFSEWGAVRKVEELDTFAKKTFGISFSFDS